MSESLFQRNGRSLIRNGNFSQGASFWYGSNLEHVDAATTHGYVDNPMDPLYSLAITRGGSSEDLPADIPKGALQFINSSNLYQYPSIKRIDRLILKPYSPTEAFLEVVKDATVVEGLVLGDKVDYALLLPLSEYPASLIFQNPFRTYGPKPGGGYEILEPKAGDYLPITGEVNPENTVVTQIISIVPDTDAFTPGDTTTVDLSKFNSFGPRIRRQSGEFAPKAASPTTGIESVTIADVEETEGNKILTFTGDENPVTDILQAEPDDIFVSGSDVGKVTNVSGSTLEITPFKNGDRLVLGNKSVFDVADYDGGVITEWALYGGNEYVSATRTLEAFNYSVTAAYSYLKTATPPEPPVVEFYALSEDSSQVEGYGEVLSSLARDRAYAISHLTRTNYPDPLVLGDTSNLSQSWGRALVPLSLESSQPLRGQPALRFPGPELPSQLDVSDILGATPENPEDGVPAELTVTVPNKYIGLIDELTSKKIGDTDFYETPISTITLRNPANPNYQFVAPEYKWLNPLLNTPLAPTVILDPSPDGEDAEATGPVLDAVSGVFTMRLVLEPVEYVDPPTEGHVNYEAGGVGLPALIAELTFKEPYRTEIGDVVLYSGNAADTFTNVGDEALLLNEFDYGILPTPLSTSTTLDPLRPQVDLFEPAVPKGTVILYAGGNVCPDGWKRVNSLQAGDGILTIPVPDSITYSAATNTSRLSWGNLTLPVFQNNQVQVVDTLSEPLLVEKGDGTSAVLAEFATPQQQVQPGMHIRVPFSDSGNAAARGHEHKEVNHFVTDVRPAPLPTEALSEASAGVSGVFSGLVVTGTIEKTPLTVDDVSGSTTPPLDPSNPNQSPYTSATAEATVTVTFKDVYFPTGLVAQETVDGQVEDVVQFPQALEDYINQGNQSEIQLFDKQDLLFQVPLYSVSDVAPGGPPGIGSFNLPAIKSGGAFGTGITWSVEDTDTIVQDGGRYYEARNIKVDIQVVAKKSFGSWYPPGNQGTSYATATNGLNALKNYLVAVNESAQPYGFPAASDSGITRLRFVEAQEAIDNSYTSNDVISYPYLIDKVEIDPPFRGFKPIAPLRKDQTSTFTDGKTVRGVVIPAAGTLEDSVIEDGQLSTLMMTVFTDVAKDSGGVLVTSPDIVPDDLTPDDLILADQSTELNSISAGSMVYVEWRTGLSFEEAQAQDPTLSQYHSEGGDFTVGFVAQIKKATPSASGYYQFELARFDARQLYTPFGNTLTESFDPSSAMGRLLDSSSGPSTVTIRPVKLFGTAVVPTPDGPDVQGSVIVPFGSDATGQWFIGAPTGSQSALDIDVQGQVTIPEGVKEITVDPGGYLQYDIPDQTLRYGAGAHSHKIQEDPDNPYEQSDEIASAPAFSSGVNDGNKYDPATEDFILDVPSSHDHGFLDQYRYNLPRFRIVTACQKL